MRATLFAFALAAGLAAAAAAAQATSTPSYMSAPVPQGMGDGRPADYFADGSERYDFEILMLKKKMGRLTREDGGQLTPAHAASLQAELDKLNRAFRPKLAHR